MRTKKTLTDNHWNYINHRINDVIYEIHRVEQSIKTDIKGTDKKIDQLKEETGQRLDRIEQMLLEALNRDDG